tara:strand:- start:72 stop:1841 length:1770 start_codon:yes stop_codon:yes gene_type:complete
MALTKISSDGVKDQNVDLTKLPHGDTNNDGKFLRANNAADPTFETVNTDVAGDSTPQLGGNLDVNGNDIVSVSNADIDIVPHGSGKTNLGGVSGVKLPIGTTAERVNIEGLIRYNSELDLPEYYNGTAWKVIETPPSITSVTPTGVETSAGGNVTFTINGARFESGATVKFIANNGTEITAASVTVNSSSRITAVVAVSNFSNAQEPYDVKVTNSSGLIGQLDDQINVDNAPSWTTSAGSLGSIYEDATGNHFTVAATDADGDTVSYSLLSGSLGGLVLNGSTGIISGDPTDVSADTTNSFTIRATGGIKTADRAFSFVTQNVPTFYDQIVTNMGLTNASRNLSILVDPFDPSSDSGSGNVTNRSGDSATASTTALSNLTRKGTGKTKHWEVDTGSGSYMSFGNPTGLTNNTTDAWAYCGWWKPNWEVDNTGIGHTLWCLNDGDWSPNSQIGVRVGQGNGFRLCSGGSGGFVNQSLRNAVYTDKWLFVCVWHRVSGGVFTGEAFATDTNLTVNFDSSSTSTSTGGSSGHNMLIGARPDNTNEDTEDYVQIGPQAAWFGGASSFVTTSEGITEAQTQFESIFDATKYRFL